MATQSSSSSSSSHTQALDPVALGIAQNFIQQLLSGGTAEQRGEQARKIQATDYISALVSSYGKDNAFKDAQGLMAAELRKALESTQPGMIRAVEGAGTSSSAMHALALNDLATRAAEQAGAFGGKMASDYGNIQANLSSVLGKLATPDNIVASTLANAIGAMKGTYNDQSQSQNSSSSSGGGGSSGGSGGGGGSGSSGGGGYSNGLGNTSGGYQSTGGSYSSNADTTNWSTADWNNWLSDQSGSTIYSNTDGSSSNYGMWYTDPNFGNYNSGSSSYWDSGASSDSFYSDYASGGGQVYPDYAPVLGQSADYTGGGWDPNAGW